MMLEKIIVSDIQQDIVDVQHELKSMKEESSSGALLSQATVKCDESQPKRVKTSSDESNSMDVKYANPLDNIKDEPDYLPACVEQFENHVRKVSTAVHSSSASSGVIDVKPNVQDRLHKELPFDLNFPYEALGAEKPSQSIKKELEALDVETEITSSYIMKKSDDHSQTKNLSLPNSAPVTLTAPAASSNIAREPSPINPADFDYLCGNSTSTMQSNSSSNQNSSNRKKDELIACDKEYDEWFCIQKELSLISDKRPSESIMDGFIDGKLSVENHFPDLFANDHQTNQHDNLDGKSDLVGNHSPLSELFNESIVSNAVGGVNDKSVENRLENMFSDSSEFEKTNDLVESRLEELFHGSSPTQASSSACDVVASQLLSSQPYVNSHDNSHSNYLLGQQNTSNQLVGSGSNNASNKRHWANNSNLMPQISPSQLHPSKRSCMMSSYMETTAATDDHHWMMECQQSSGYDFMSTGDANLDASTNKSVWNGAASCDGAANASVMNGLPCDGSANDAMLMNSIHTTKKQCYSAASVKSHDLEHDLLGLNSHASSSALDNANSVLMHLQQNHMHSENSYDTSTMPGSNTNTASNSLSSNFEDDINRHVQNAIDSILNLQNSENDPLHYLDQSMGSFLNDGPLSSSYPNVAHPSPSLGMGSNRQMQTMMHQQGMQHNHQQQPHSNHYMNTHKRRSNHFDESTDCLISGGRNIGDGNASGVDMMMDSPPTLEQANAASANLADFMGIDDPVKSIITS